MIIAACAGLAWVTCAYAGVTKVRRIRNLPRFMAALAAIELTVAIAIALAPEAGLVMCAILYTAFAVRSTTLRTAVAELRLLRRRA